MNREEIVLSIDLNNKLVDRIEKVLTVITHNSKLNLPFTKDTDEIINIESTEEGLSILYWYEIEKGIIFKTVDEIEVTIQISWEDLEITLGALKSKYQFPILDSGFKRTKI